ncbi:MAG TPA: LysM peptidoglycan-binding domain-containing protein [Candidatus Omnitrophica bacterium]|nr:LysM peptidoglycan-binding domain-containing protein [Candidatus Omnitrophota bacterium]
MIKPRVDQDLSSGNRGYISGNIPPQEDIERKETRQTYEFEIELSNPFNRKKEVVEPAAVEDIILPDVSFEEDLSGESFDDFSNLDVEGDSGFEIYTVGKRDTLQKISDKFYGTTRKWQKIYEANKDVLKSPDRLYPGQEIKIPIE